MKKFQFHLGKLLSYKDQNLENEMMILGGLTRQLSEEMDKQLDLEDQQEKCQKNYEQDMANFHYADGMSGVYSLYVFFKRAN